MPLHDLLIEVQQVGQPTVLVNNAGVTQGKLLLDLDPEDIKQSVRNIKCCGDLLHCPQDFQRKYLG